MEEAAFSLVPRLCLGTHCPQGSAFLRLAGIATEARRSDLGPRSFTWAHGIVLAVVNGSYGGGASQTVRAQAEPGYQEPVGNKE